MSIQVSTRIDTETKQQFDRICESIGVSPSNVLSMLIKGVINYNGIPFNVIAPKERPLKMSRADTFGYMRGQFKMAEDFDAPLDDFEEHMK